MIIPYGRPTVDILLTISLITSLILYFRIKEKKINDLQFILTLLIIMISIIYFTVRFHIANLLLLMILIPGIPPF